MNTKPILIISILLNITTLVLATAFVERKGGLVWIESKLPFFKQQLHQKPDMPLPNVDGRILKPDMPLPNVDGPILKPHMPLPNVDGRILLLGDSHLAIHPWAEYSSLPFSNRAISGSRISDINIDVVKGNPSLIVISTSTNDIQAKNPLSTEEIKKSLKGLFLQLKSKWPESKIIYISGPYPNIKIYEGYIRDKHPNINRPMPIQIDSIRKYVSSLGIMTIQAKSANIDGLHIDPESAIAIVNKIEEIFANKANAADAKSRAAD